MSSTFGMFEAAKSGLSVAMQQLAVTEQNIANVNTEGYTRQRLLISSKEPASSRYLIAQLTKASVGQGVKADGVQQIRSAYLDSQYRVLNTGYGYSKSRTEALEYMTGALNELSEESGLKTAIGNFFSALNTLSSDTSSKEYRTNVQQQALGMTATFNHIYEELESLWQNQNENIGAVADEINSIAQKIAALNEAIARCVQTGGSANELKDERNLLLDKLSGYVNITYSYNADNESMLDVKIGGLTLVEGKTASVIAKDSVADHASDINAILSNIAAWNADPASNAAALAQAQVDLAAFGDFTFTTNGSGGLDVSFGGVSLVSGTSSKQIEQAVESSASAWAAFNRTNLMLGGSPLSVESGTVTGGQLYAHMEMVSSTSALSPGIPYYMDELNALVREMAKNLNDISRSGWTYPDGSTPSQTGINLFYAPFDSVLGDYDYSKITAGNFKLSDEVLQSVYNIPASSVQVDLSGGSTEAGNNVVAQQLCNDLTVSGYYDKLNSVVTSLAISTNTSRSILATRESLIGSVETQRQSESAVSLDEETTNLIVFQQTYQACARVITTIDEMLDKMINSMGIVGR